MRSLYTPSPGLGVGEEAAVGKRLGIILVAVVVLGAIAITLTWLLTKDSQSPAGDNKPVHSDIEDRGTDGTTGTDPFEDIRATGAITVYTTTTGNPPTTEVVTSTVPLPTK